MARSTIDGAGDITPAQIIADIEKLLTLDEQMATVRELLRNDTPLIHEFLRSQEFVNWFNKNKAGIIEAGHRERKARYGI